MRLDIKHWQLLEAVARYGSLGRAADAIGVTQSALSHRLAEAERRLGSAIFERDGRKLKVTPAGQALLHTAQAVLPELARAEQDFERTAASASYLVRIGVAEYSAYHWVPGFLKSLPMSREKLQIDFVAAATREAEQTLLAGTTDLLISPAKIENPALISHPLMKDELVLITHPQHPLATKPFIEAEELIDQDYLTYSLDALPGFEYERFIRPAGIRLRHIQMVEMTDAIVEMIAVDLGVSILSRWALSRSLKQGLVVAIPVTEQRLPLTWYVVARKSDARYVAIQETKNALLRWFGSEA
ncbi:LysR family transcriptional regulator [Pontibacterium granulatum]|uniref:LysR family transcriptional regulator n=1 Tax=Pontibacterium granulatum TaxID=2036029 RepID=UPI00249BA68C|nr:LysR family transcriptional regulator [Pontibacterium granulatum]MDI3325583.1 LysR family transcriptional regulator [Pontibacterium granulatum]